VSRGEPVRPPGAQIQDGSLTTCAANGRHRKLHCALPSLRQKPVLIGHSLGGAVVLELCGRYSELASGMVTIDSIVMAPASLRDSPDLQRLPDGIGGPNYLAVSRANAWEIGCDFDDPAGRMMIYETYVTPPGEKIPQQAAYSAIKNFTRNYDPAPALHPVGCSEDDAP